MIDFNKINFMYTARMKTLFTLPLLFFGLINSPSSYAVKYEEVKIDEKYVHVIDQGSMDADSPVVSDDETELTWLGDHHHSFVPPSRVYQKDLVTNSPETELKKGISRALNIYTKSSFMPNGMLVTAELEWRLGAILLSTAKYLKVKDWKPTGYHSVISTYQNGMKISALDYKDFGLTCNNVLEHPRVSPDQQFLTFYVQDDLIRQGVYVYEIGSTHTEYLGNAEDKHPTWSPDGKRIYFHHQGIQQGTNAEISELGYYDVVLNNGAVLSSKRVLLDSTAPFGSTFIYEKHPAAHAGLNLLFFHGLTDADGKKFIGVRSLDHPGKNLILKMSFEGKEIKSEKHVTLSARTDSSLYFVGKLKGEDAVRIFKVDYDGLKDLPKKF